MKLIRKSIERDLSGWVTLLPEEDEDLWHCYNLIQEGDEVRAPAIRRVQTTSSTGSTDSHRVRLNLTLEVTKTFFSPSATGGPSDSPANGSTSSAGAAASGPPQGAQLQISGRVTSENVHVKLGAYHTLDLEANREFKLGKGPGGWDSVNVGRVEEASAEGAGAEVAAVVVGEGTAAICLLTNHMTVVRQRIESPIPRKRKGMSSAHEKATEKFHSLLTSALHRHLAPLLSTLRALIIAGPGFAREAFLEYFFADAVHTANKPVLGLRSKVMKVNTGSGHVHSLVEALRAPEVANQLKDTKFAREGIMLDKFNKMLNSDELRAWYGPDHVEKAIERGAVGTLLISDTLFRSHDVAQRKRFVSMVEDVRDRGGEALIFSAMHETGHQLDQLTGIAAILTYPLDIETVEMEERVEKEDREREQREREEADGNGNGRAG